MEREGSCHRLTVVDQCSKGHECGFLGWPLQTHDFNQLIGYIRRQVNRYLLVLALVGTLAADEESFLFEDVLCDADSFVQRRRDFTEAFRGIEIEQTAGVEDEAGGVALQSGSALGVLLRNAATEFDGQGRNFPFIEHMEGIAQPLYGLPGRHAVGSQ